MPLQPERQKSSQQKQSRGFTFVRARVRTEYVGDADASEHDAASAHGHTVAF